MLRLPCQSGLLVAFAVGALLWGPASRLSAENWPGWRKDGTGVSQEGTVPVQWSATDNVQWKAAVPGEGHSSPIVWGDQVIVTTVNPTVQRHRWVPTLYVILTLLCGLVLWRLTNGTFADPLGNHANDWTSNESRLTGSLRRAAVGLLFVAISYGTVIATEWSYDFLEIYPESLRNRLIDMTWYFTDAPGYEELATPVSAFRFVTGHQVEGPFFGAPRIPLACYYGGGLAILSVLGVNTALARRRNRGRELSGQRQAGVSGKRLIRLRANLLGLDFRFGVRAEQRFGGILQSLGEWCACLVAAFALITVHSAAMADLPFTPSGTTWFLTVAVGLLTLMAFHLLLPGRPWIRIMGAAITGAILFYWIIYAPPNEEFGIFATAQRAGLRPLLKIYVGCIALGLVVPWVSPWKSAGDTKGNTAAHAWSNVLAATGILGCGLIYFVTSNYLLPERVNSREVISFDRHSGERRWTARCDASEIISKLHAANSLATPTPVTDGTNVYAHFGDAGVYCVDMQGNVRWQFKDPVPTPHWGSASSPVLWRDLLIMTYDSDHHSLTVAIDKLTGRERWRDDRTGKIEPSQLLDGYATPVLYRNNGQEQLLHVACKLLVCYDPATGKRIWEMEHPGEQPVATPAIAGDLALILGGKYAPYFAAVQIGTRDGSSAAEVIWEASRNLSDMPSPAVYDGNLYMITKDGIATCIDVQSGHYHWRHRVGGAHWASVTAAAGKVFFCDANGKTTVIEAGPKYKELGENEIDEDVYASFAISEGAIFLRTAKHLFCIGE